MLFPKSGHRSIRALNRIQSFPSGCLRAISSTVFAQWERGVVPCITRSALNADAIGAAQCSCGDSALSAVISRQRLAAASWRSCLVGKNCRSKREESCAERRCDGRGALSGCSTTMRGRYSQSSIWPNASINNKSRGAGWQSSGAKCCVRLVRKTISALSGAGRLSPRPSRFSAAALQQRAAQ